MKGLFGVYWGFCNPCDSPRTLLQWVDGGPYECTKCHSLDCCLGDFGEMTVTLVTA